MYTVNVTFSLYNFLCINLENKIIIMTLVAENHSLVCFYNCCISLFLRALTLMNFSFLSCTKYKFLPEVANKTMPCYTYYVREIIPESVNLKVKMKKKMMKKKMKSLRTLFSAKE